MFIRHTNRIIGYTVALLSACLADATAQKSWDAHVNIGYASYSHRELRAYHDYLLRELVVEGTSTDKFPAYLTYSLNITKNWTQWTLALELGHGSTGGRIYYEDYSGTLIADQLVNYNYFATTPSVVLYRKEKLMLTAGLKVSMIFHKLTIRNSLSIGDEMLREEVKFRSVNMGFQPHLRLRKDFGSSFFMQASAGYEIQDKAEALGTENDAAFLADENHEPVHLQGSGVRVNIGIGVAF